MRVSTSFTKNSSISPGGLVDKPSQAGGRKDFDVFINIGNISISATKTSASELNQLKIPPFTFLSISLCLSLFLLSYWHFCRLWQGSPLLPSVSAIFLFFSSYQTLLIQQLKHQHQSSTISQSYTWAGLVKGSIQQVGSSQRHLEKTGQHFSSSLVIFQL